MIYTYTWNARLGKKIVFVLESDSYFITICRTVFSVVQFSRWHVVGVFGWLALLLYKADYSSERIIN